MYINCNLSVNCVWGTWGAWATCTCGSNTQLRTRQITTHEENGGTACSEASAEQQTCVAQSCTAGMLIHKTPEDNGNINFSIYK